MMCNKLLAVASSLLFSVGNPEDPVCQNFVDKPESGGEVGGSLLLLQKSAVLWKQSSSSVESARGKYGLNEKNVRKQDQQFVKVLTQILQESGEQRVSPSPNYNEESSSDESEIRARKIEVVQDMDDGHKATFTKMHSKLTAAAPRSGAARLDGQAAVARINNRFGNGRPSNKFNEAGVVVHAFDGKFLSGADDGVGWSSSSNHWSASIINARVPYMFLGDFVQSLHAGFVISPDAATASLLCSYDGDGVTMTLNPCYDGTELATDCIDGCIGVREATPTAPQAVRQWCTINTTVQTSMHQATAAAPADDRCAWPPNALDAMMRQQEVHANKSDWLGSCRSGPCLFDNPYNEIVLDPNKIQKNMLEAIEAIYFVTGPAASSLSHEHKTTGEAEAKSAQRLLWKMHGLRVPLVRFEPFRAHMPFDFVNQEVSH
mmetsp:Transcript_99688/g.191369  ORF Transcript_99688/g.191369 Transcript_99688/m.191369 type:complete len:432 (-) Transcript_99688:54-1349(-)